jgi:hypothetical protein
MTSERASAYARVMMTLKSLGPAKLMPAEQALTRHAADSLLFCLDLVHDGLARTAFADFEDVRERLVASGRWTAQRAAELADDVWACGPTVAPAMLHAA